MPTAPYALSSIPLFTADKPAVDLTGRLNPRGELSSLAVSYPFLPSTHYACTIPYLPTIQMKGDMLG
jgi:hypothetical protein